jgi:predicted ATPase
LSIIDLISHKDTAIHIFFSLIIYADFYSVKHLKAHPKKVVITGGPGTGKTSVINHLKGQGFICYDEISREVTLQARQDGIEQLFLTQPLLFSERLLKGRTQQFLDAQNERESVIFLDRGIPDILAYMHYSGDDYPQHFVEACQKHVYDMVFVLAPWREIFESDSERYENFEQAEQIHQQLIATYKHYQYDLIDVPFDSVAKRTDFLIDTLSHL